MARVMCVTEIRRMFMLMVAALVICGGLGATLALGGDCCRPGRCCPTASGPVRVSDCPERWGYVIEKGKLWSGVLRPAGGGTWTFHSDGESCEAVSINPELVTLTKADLAQRTWQAKSVSEGGQCPTSPGKAPCCTKCANPCKCTRCGCQPIRRAALLPLRVGRKAIWFVTPRGLVHYSPNGPCGAGK